MTDSDDAPSTGDRVRYFGEYELLDEIARGGMGVVFKARQVKLNRIVALKMILSGELAGDEEVQRFKTEAEAAAKLDHPGIVPIYEIGEHQGQHYFSMGFVEGQSLADRVKDGPLPPGEAAEIVKKVADAVAYAHEKRVIHRDLKPANVLLDANGEPRVTDFGLAKQVESDSDLTRTGAVMGTPSYMPPEQASGKTDEIEQRSDVYSLGAILYCLVTGRPPFEGASAVDVLMQVIATSPIPPRRLNRRVSRDLETLCSKCLDKEKNARYRSASELSADLSRMINGHPIKARSLGRMSRAYRWCKRNKMMTFWISACVTSLLYPLIFGLIGVAMLWMSAVNAMNDNAKLMTGAGIALGHVDESGRLILPGVRVERKFEDLERHTTIGGAAYRFVAGPIDSSEFRAGGVLQVWVEIDYRGETSRNYERTYDLTAKPHDASFPEVDFGLLRIPTDGAEQEPMEFQMGWERLTKRVSSTSANHRKAKSLFSEVSVESGHEFTEESAAGTSFKSVPLALGLRGISANELWQKIRQRNDLTEPERAMFEQSLSTSDESVNLYSQVSQTQEAALTEFDTDICLYGIAYDYNRKLRELRRKHSLAAREDAPEYAFRIMCRLLRGGD